MLITATSSLTDPVLLNPTEGTRFAVHGSNASNTASSAPASSASGSSATNFSATAASSSGAHARVSRSGGSGATGAASAMETLAGAYTATIGGTQYAGSVEQEGSAYVASVPSVPGATVTGATLMEAENNLTNRIDALV